MPLDPGREFVHFPAGGDSFTFLAFLFLDVGEYHPGNQGQEHQIHPAYHRANQADVFQPHDHLRANLEADHSSNQHDHAQLLESMFPNFPWRMVEISDLPAM